MKKSHTYLSFRPRIQLTLLGLMCLLGAFTPHPQKLKIDEPMVFRYSCEAEVVDVEDFERGWGSWNDGGQDAFRYESPYFSPGGSYAVLLRDNDVGSHITSDAFDFSGFSSVTVHFSYVVSSFELGEDFWLQISQDGGKSFQTVETWTVGNEFQNDEEHREEVILTGPFSDETLVRFRCDASGNRDYLFIDNIQIEACKETQAKAGTASCSATGSIGMEAWLNIGDSHSVNDIPLNTPPSYTETLTQFEIPINTHERYGVRVRGFICPPMTGEYTFWISSDDKGELWLSTDHNPANKKRIAHVPGWTQSRQWTKYSEQQSRSMYLEAGKSYYVEALMKEGIGEDNLAVKWRRPDNNIEEPIPGAYLSPYQDDLSRYSQEKGDLCSFGGETLYSLQENFETGVGSLSYSDDVFFDTQAPRYASGGWQQNVGPSGGSSLGIYLGGRDNVAVYGMSGAWSHTFYLEEAAEVDLSFWYAMVQGSNFESDEYSQVVFSLDGNEYPLAKLTGNGNGGKNQYVNWQEESRSLGVLSAGSHTLSFGGYLYKKTYYDEQANVYFDLLEVTAKSVSNTAPVADFDLAQQTEQEAITVTVDASETRDLEGDPLNYSWDFGEGTTKSGKLVNHAYTSSGTYEITLTVTDNKGCSSQSRKSLVVEIPYPKGLPPIEVEVIPTQPTQCDGTGSVEVITNRGTVRITKEGELIEDYASLSPGTYNWEVIDGDEGESGSFTINEYYLLPEIRQTSTTDASCSEPDGTIKIAFENNSNREDISFSIDGGQNYPLKVPVSSGNAQFIGLEAGTYEIWARWGNGECATYVGSVEVASSEAPTVSIDPAGPFEETANPFRLVANPAGGTWTGPVSADGTFDPSIGEGTYQVDYRYVDENGCTGSASVNLEVLPSTSTCRARIVEVGPLTPDQRIIQLEATPAGGTWAGDVTPGGSFDPSCPGMYTVSYTYSDGADCFTTDTTTIWVQSEVKDIIIIAGQSNAVGANNTPAVLTLDSDPIDAFIDYSWNIPEEFLQEGWSNMQLIPAQGNRFSHGAEVSLSRELFNSGYNNLGIIKVAKGGTNLDQNWNPNTAEQGYDGNGGGMYPEMVNFVRARLSELESQGISYRVSGFFWHQGEGDMTAYRAPRYESNLINFIAKVREEFGANLPFFIAKVYNPNATAAEQEAVQLAQQSVAGVDPNTFLMDLDQIYFDPNRRPNQGNLVPDLLHYNSAGLVKVGEIFANTYRGNFPIVGCNEDLGNLCETSLNLALGKQTAQSSTYGQGTSDLAVDGIQEGSSPWTADLAHTEVEFQPWWEVDLGVIANVEQVRIYNRTDCCFGRLNNFSIFVSNDPFPADASLTSLRNDPSISFVTFSGSAGLTEFINIEASGRYVRIQHSREIQLHMAEVEVWGCSQSTQASRFNGVADAIEVDEENAGIKVFPNPTQNVLIVQTEEKDVNKAVEISLYNLAGQIVQKVRGVEGYTSLNVSNLARGMYALQVKGEDWIHIQKISLE